MFLTDLQAASFKGAAFFVPEDEAEVGRNNILHHYPDSPVRYAEDNGGIAPCFEIRGLVFGAGIQGKVNALKRAFSSPGPGLLKHPWYGNQFCAVDQTIRFKRSDKHSGVVEFDVKLVVTGPPQFPGLISGIAAVVTGLSGSLVTTAFRNFAARYGTPTSANSLVRVSEALEDVCDKLNERFRSASAVPSRIAAQPTRYLADVSALAVSLDEAFRTPFDDDAITNSTLVDGFAEVFDTATAIVTDAAGISATTPDLIWRKDVLGEFGETVEIVAFASLAEAMAGRDYATADEVEADEAALGDAFETIQARTSLEYTTVDDASDILTAALGVLRDKAVRLPRLTTINLPSVMPASVLAYTLYEDPGAVVDYYTLAQRIGDLNATQNPAALVGDTTVITGG